MKHLSALILAIVSGAVSSASFAFPVTVKVYGVNHELLLQKKSEVQGGSVGTLSDQVLKAALSTHVLTEYQGSEGGVSSINHLNGALEVLSDIEMNAYGWCYKVDGQAPDVMADQYLFTGHESVVEWDYVYSHLIRDQWTSMCTPATHVPRQEQE
jgi:hypothetical protein